MSALLTFPRDRCTMTFAYTVHDTLRRPRVRRALDAITGATLVALGLRLATERR